MASGQITGVTYHGGYRLEIDWSSIVDETNNRSNVTAKVYLVCDPGFGLNFSATKNGNTTIDLDSLNWTYSNGVSTSGGTRHLLHERSLYVDHNNDGTKDCSLSAWFEPEVTISGNPTGRWEVSGVATLDKIERGVMYTKVNGEWKKGQTWIKVNGTWVKAKAVFTNVNGVWQQSK